MKRPSKPFRALNWFLLEQNKIMEREWMISVILFDKFMIYVWDGVLENVRDINDKF